MQDEEDVMGLLKHLAERPQGRASIQDLAAEFGMVRVQRALKNGTAERKIFSKHSGQSADRPLVAQVDIVRITTEGRLSIAQPRA
jgi:hypothetical protein